MSIFLQSTKSIIIACQGWYVRSAHYFYVHFLEPKSVREDDKRAERILTLILFFITAVTAIFEIGLVIQYIKLGEKYHGVPIPIYTTILLLFIGLYVTVRKKHHRIAGYIFIAILLSSISYTSYTWGASLPMGLLAYGLVVTIASIVISSRFGFVIALISCLLILVFGLHEHATQILPAWKKEAIEIHDIIGYGIMIGLTALLSRMSNKEMEKSLVRARASELALKEERDNLEVLVEARTKALYESERERMRELYRFAEFGKLSSGIFHDLLNPLTAVSLSVTRLSEKQKGSVENSEAVASLETAIQATQRMEKLMTAVRKQIKSEDLRCHFILNEEIQDAIRLTHYRAEKSNVAITFNDPENITYHGNPLKFNQVITNLICNAIDSCVQEKHSSRKYVVVIQLTNSADNVACSITDNGSGIDPETAGKIFNPFFSTKDSGLGIGLSTSKDIIEEHFGGSISCASEIGNGATFTILLPKQNNGQIPEKQNQNQHPIRMDIP
ncbi:MAG: hypothetical protein RL641_383 [Candidatus Parcubacteria bacterium]|jgi:signal transduction histidine kinase